MTIQRRSGQVKMTRRQFQRFIWRQQVWHGFVYFIPDLAHRLTCRIKGHLRDDMKEYIEGAGTYDPGQDFCDRCNRWVARI